MMCFSSILALYQRKGTLVINIKMLNVFEVSYNTLLKYRVSLFW